MTNAVTIAQGGSTSSVTGYRNRLLNGGLDIWQRGTSFNAPSNLYMADRWKCGYQDDGAVYTQQASDLPGFNYYIRMIKGGTANGSHMIQQAIETQNTPDMIGQWVTFSCWARLSNTTTQASHQLNMALGFSATTDYSGWLNSADICSYYAKWNAAGVNGITFQAGSTTVNPSTPVQNTLSLTTSWQRFYYTLFVPSNTKTIVCGVYSEATLQNGGIDVTGVQFELGTSPSPFDRRHIQTELTMCQRYFETNYPQGYAPGSNSGINGCWFSVSLNGGDFYDSGRLAFIVPKRTDAPTVTLYNPVTGAGNWYDVNIGSANGNTAVSNAGKYGCYMYASTAFTANHRYAIRYTAESEI